MADETWGVGHFDLAVRAADRSGPMNGGVAGREAELGSSTAAEGSDRWAGVWKCPMTGRAKVRRAGREVVLRSGTVAEGSDQLVPRLADGVDGLLRGDGWWGTLSFRAGEYLVRSMGDDGMAVAGRVGRRRRALGSGPVALGPRSAGRVHG
ncbi:hypothetical protein HerbRD11066_56670 [Herbidospora sp. RD11066]